MVKMITLCTRYIHQGSLNGNSGVLSNAGDAVGQLHTIPMEVADLVRVI